MDAEDAHEVSVPGSVHFGEGTPINLTPKYPPTPHFEIEIKEKKLTYRKEAYRHINRCQLQAPTLRRRKWKFPDHRSFASIDQIPYLLYLRAERNSLESAGLKVAPYLQVLLLNMNQIAETCDINQPMLELLELGENVIYTAQFDAERLPNLKELSLHNNHLIDTSGCIRAAWKSSTLTRIG
nr:unnamed protein product [Callosobruchus analis]